MMKPLGRSQRLLSCYLNYSSFFICVTIRFSFFPFIVLHRFGCWPESYGLE